MKYKKEKLKVKPKERQGVLSTGEHHWTDRPVTHAFQVRVAVGTFFEELFSRVFGYRRVKSSELDGIPDMLFQKNGKPWLGEVKASYRSSQYKLDPKQIKIYRDLIDDKKYGDVRWVFVIHDAKGITKQVEWESDIYKLLGQNIIGAVVTTQKYVEEMIYNIPVSHFTNSWGDLQLLPACVVRYMMEDDEEEKADKRKKVKERLRLETLRLQREDVPEQKVYGYNIPGFPVFYMTCRGKYHDDAF